MPSFYSRLKEAHRNVPAATYRFMIISLTLFTIIAIGGFCLGPLFKLIDITKQINTTAHGTSNICYMTEINNLFKTSDFNGYEFAATVGFVFPDQCRTNKFIQSIPYDPVDCFNLTIPRECIVASNLNCRERNSVVLYPIYALPPSVMRDINISLIIGIIAFVLPCLIYLTVIIYNLIPRRNQVQLTSSEEIEL